MADLQLSKTLVKARTDLFGETISTGSKTVDLSSHGTRVELILTKIVPEVQRGISSSRYSSNDPTTILHDYKKTYWIFRLTGKIAKATFELASDVMADIIAIIEDGGTFTFDWHGNEFTVNCKAAQFVEKGGTPYVLDFTIDLIKGQAR